MNKSTNDCAKNIKTLPHTHYTMWPKIISTWSSFAKRKLTKQSIIKKNAYMKNCEPLVSFPRFAIDSRNSLSWFRIKFSSATIHKHTYNTTFTHGGDNK